MNHDRLVALKARYDPDDFFARNLHSKSEYSNVLSGWENGRYDALVEEAKRTLDPVRRKELYTEAWNIVNVELPFSTCMR